MTFESSPIAVITLFSPSKGPLPGSGLRGGNLKKPWSILGGTCKRQQGNCLLG